MMDLNKLSERGGMVILDCPILSNSWGSELFKFQTIGNYVTISDNVSGPGPVPGQGPVPGPIRGPGPVPGLGTGPVPIPVISGPNN